MKPETMMLFSIMVSLLSGCGKAEVADNRNEVSTDLPKTDRSQVELASRFLKSELRWTDSRTDSGSGPVSLFAPRPRPGEVFLSPDPLFELSQAKISISSLFLTFAGKLQATISNETEREIRIHPTGCGVEIHIGDKIGTLMAVDPGILEFGSLRILPGKATDFTFDFIPGLADLNGDLQLFVHAISTEPLEMDTIRSERFQIADLETRSGANKPRHPSPDRSESK